MHIIFSHGRGGKPNGTKIRHLSGIAIDQGHTTESVDYTDTQDPDIRAERLHEVVKKQTIPFCLVGSSMGGYASLLAAESADKSLLCGVFLMAPGLYLPRYQQQTYTTDIAHIEIVHGWDDTVVLHEHSIRYARTANCTLHLLDDDHRFSRDLYYVGRLFKQFLSSVSRLS